MVITAVGETVLDIVIKNGKPLAANPGGSALNTIISLSRLGMAARFITEMGGDETGRRIRNFLQDNLIISDTLAIYSDSKTAIALAYLDENNNATYTFYKDYPSERLAVDMPNFSAQDLLLFGSSFARNEDVRNALQGLIKSANDAGSIIYYDPNFRLNAGSSSQLGMMVENMKMSSIVRGSDEDFLGIFGNTNLPDIYRQIQSDLPQLLICTESDKTVTVYSSQGTMCTFPVPKVHVKSTIGAGDNFNAGFLFGLARNGITRENLPFLGQPILEAICTDAIACASHVCASLENYISKDFAEFYRRQSVEQ